MLDIEEKIEPVKKQIYCVDINLSLARSSLYKGESKPPRLSFLESNKIQ